MKRLTIAALVLCLPLLGGCGMLRGGYPRLEQLRVVQTLGVDDTGSGLRLTLATAAGDRSEDDAVCLSAEGPNLSAALARAESYSTEETLFCGHIRQMEKTQRWSPCWPQSAAQRICGWTCRSICCAGHA